MSAARRLPGGRGIATGEAAFRDQGESFEGRLAVLPKPIQQWACPANPWMFKEVSTYTANKTYLFTLPLSAYDMVTDQVRIRVTANVAASTARVAIYRLDFDTNTFAIVPGSEASLSGASIATVTANLARPVRLVADKPYFLGFKPSSASLEVASISSVATAGIINSLQVAGSAGVMFSSINLNALTRTINSAVPGVIYLNRIWRDYV